MFALHVPPIAGSSRPSHSAPFLFSSPLLAPGHSWCAGLGIFPPTSVRQTREQGGPSLGLLLAMPGGSVSLQEAFLLLILHRLFLF